jgi:hypothetical protein
MRKRTFCEDLRTLNCEGAVSVEPSRGPSVWLITRRATADWQDNSHYSGLWHVLVCRGLRSRGHTMGTKESEIQTLDDAIRWLRGAPPGTLIPADTMAELISSVKEAAPPDPRAGVSESGFQGSWRERLWTVPSETRLGVSELSEALGRKRSWIYARTQQEGKTAKDRSERLPHRRLDGVLVFVAGEIRRWVREREESFSECPMEPPTIPSRGGLRLS